MFSNIFDKEVMTTLSKDDVWYTLLDVNLKETPVSTVTNVSEKKFLFFKVV